MSTSYLENLARAGVQPADVDVVINTHLHAGHVGWNTRRDNGSSDRRRLTLHSALGHTPGFSVLVARCGGRTAVFTGDLFHSPLQVIEPHWGSCYDEEARAAEASRRRTLSLAADTGALVLPAHLPGVRNRPAQNFLF